MSQLKIANRHILCTCPFEVAAEIQPKVRGFYSISAREHPVERYFMGYKNFGAVVSIPKFQWMAS